MTTESIPLKRCSKKGKCVHPEAVDGGWLPKTLVYFGRHTKQFDGFRSLCKSCSSYYAKQKRLDPNFSFREPIYANGMQRCCKKDKCVHPDADENGWLPATAAYFNADKRRKFGLSSECKKCKDKGLKEYYINHPGKRREITTRYHFTHKEEKRERGRIYRSTHPDKVAAGRARYREEHPEVVRAATLRRRARKRSLPDTFTTEDWQNTLDYFGNKCAACGRLPDFWTTLAADHWIPQAKGGPTTKENIIPLCHARKDVPEGIRCCNNSKRDYDPEEWLIDHFGARKAKAILKRINDYFEWVKAQK